MAKKTFFPLLLLLLIGIRLPLHAKKADANERPRVVIMTDAETDDRCSMIHALLYANDMEVFNQAMDDACSWWIRHNKPAKSRRWVV